MVVPAPVNVCADAPLNVTKRELGVNVPELVKLPATLRSAPIVLLSAKVLAAPIVRIPAIPLAAAGIFTELEVSVTFCGTPAPAVVAFPVHSVPTPYPVTLLYNKVDALPYIGALILANPPVLICSVPKTVVSPLPKSKPAVSTVVMLEAKIKLPLDVEVTVFPPVIAMIPPATPELIVLAAPVT